MPGTFTYTVATNKIVVTDGTSVAPATFNDMYLADQAGTGTVLNVAENGAAAVTLDYQIRPTHSKALKVKCIVAAKTAEADYIFISGTDAWDAAQTEALDVTAGNGSYETTKRFKTITNLDCSDNAAGGGEVWADGTIAVTQDIWGVVWEYVADGDYKIDCIVDFSNAVTATYFQSKNELVYFATGMRFLVTANATLTLGAKSGDWGISGSSWIYTSDASEIICNTGGTLNLYDSRLTNLTQTNSQQSIFSGTIEMKNATLAGGGSAKVRWVFTNTTTDLERVYINNSGYGIGLTATLSALNNIHAHLCAYGVFALFGATVENILITNSTTADVGTFNVNTVAVVKDPATSLGTIYIGSAGGNVTEQYTCNIHIADEDGADLSGVTVQCQTFGNVVSNDAGATFYKCIVGHTSGVDGGFAAELLAGKWELTTAAYAAKAGCVGGAGTGAWVTGIAYVAAASEFSVATGSDGDIAEQTIDYKKWSGTSEALLTYSLHTFTFTHADYPDFVINDVTIDYPIVWRQEMGISTANLTTVVQTVVETNKLDHLVAVADSDDPVNNSIIAKLVSKDATADWSDYSNQTESLEALKDGVLDTIAGDVVNVDGIIPSTPGDAMTLVADQAVNVTKIVGAAVATGTAQIGVNIVSEDNIDFGAAKKTSLNNATPSVTVSDKTGFSLSTAGILDIWHQALAQIVTASTIGKKIKDWVLGTDNKALISVNAQDLSATFDVNAKLLGGASPNNAITAPTTGQIRTELATELGRMDAAITSRNSVIPDAAGIAATLHGVTNGKVDAVQVSATFIKNVTEGDVTIDTTTTPWQLVVKTKSTDTELIRKDLKDVVAANISSVSTVIGQQTEP